MHYSWNESLHLRPARKSLPLTLRETRPAGPGHGLLTLDNPFGPVMPGQFIMLAPGPGEEPYLKRPLSVLHADRQSVHVLVKDAGRGSRLLLNQPPGVTLAAVGPLGNCFPRPLERHRRVVLAGGGVGVPPLLFYARSLGDEGFAGETAACLGARTRDLLLLLPEFTAVCTEVLCATDDGSLGRKGLVSDAVRIALDGQDPGGVLVLCCGPTPMMKAVATLCVGAGIDCLVSLEEFMACGTGLCMGCAVHTRQRGYLRVCTDGPVFEAADITAFTGGEDKT